MQNLSLPESGRLMFPLKIPAFLNRHISPISQYPYIPIFKYPYTGVNPYVSMHREKFKQQKEEQGSLGSRPVKSTRHLDRNCRTPFGEDRTSRLREKRHPLDKDRRSDVYEGRTGVHSISTDVSSRAMWTETTPAR